MKKCLNEMILLSLSLLLLMLMNIASTSILRNDEKLLRVQNVEEAQGKPYFLDFIGLSKKYGYKAENHFVNTEDGYILEIFRIPKSLSQPKVDGKPVVLIMHGLGSSSDIWAFFNRSLAYFLADSGYDVWAGNFRGNTYGRLHKSLSPEQPLFWNFTFHEIGVLDYPAIIDYILKLTNKSTLTLVAHSMGSTSAIILLSEKPEYNKKINLAITMAPTTYWKKPDPLRLTLLSVIYLFKDFVDPTGMSEFLPQSILTSRLINDFCKKFNLMDLCIGSIGLLVGYDPEQSATEDILSSVNYFPAGSSTKCVWHYCQLAKTLGKFRQYDYGIQNYMYYGQVDPPDYNVTNIATNMLLVYAKNDPFSTKQDNAEFIKHLKIKPAVLEVDYPKFTHLDYVLAKDIKKLLYDNLLIFISKYAY